MSSLLFPPPESNPKTAEQANIIEQADLIELHENPEVGESLEENLLDSRIEGAEQPGTDSVESKLFLPATRVTELEEKAIEENNNKKDIEKIWNLVTLNFILCLTNLVLVTLVATKVI